MPEGPLFSFKSELHEFGIDEDGDPITVNVVSDDMVSVQSAPNAREPKLTPTSKPCSASCMTPEHVVFDAKSGTARQKTSASEYDAEPT